MQLSRVLRNFSAFSTWAKVPLGPADPILGVAAQFRADTDPKKVNLSIGAYRDNTGKPVVLNSVKKAQQLIVDRNLDNEYLPVEGLAPFIDGSIKLAYGQAFHAANLNRVAGCQALSGTGAVRLGLEFLKKFLPPATVVYMPAPTWPNHHNIARDAGFQFKEYKYFDPSTKGVDFNGLIEDFEQIPQGSVVLLHACAHNPTGCDLTMDQWKQVMDQCKKRHLLPFFDMAYQGFTSGDIDRDASSVRLFADAGFQVILAQSFAKNMGLYGQRTGCLSVVCANPEEKERVMSQLRILARPIWSSPPLHGARVADLILNTPDLYKEWLGEVKMMANRIADQRAKLAGNLQRLGSPHDWSHIQKQIGMFAFTVIFTNQYPFKGLKADHVKELVSKYHIYLLSSGRISMSGLNDGNVEYVAQAFDAVTRQSKI